MALIGVGGAIVLTVGVAAALSRRGRGPWRFTGRLLGLGLAMCVLGGFGLLVHHFEARKASGGLHFSGRRITGAALMPARRCVTSAPEPTYVSPGGLVPGPAAACREEAPRRG